MALSLRRMGASGGGCSQQVLLAFAELRAVLATTDQATVPRMAKPIEPPAIRPVLTRLEARPTSWSSTLDRAIRVNGGAHLG